MRSKKTMYNIIFSLLFQIIAVICGFIVPKLIIVNYGSNVNGLINSITQFLAYITFLEAGVGPVVKAALYKPIANKDKKQIENILKASEKFFRIIALIFIVYLIILTFTYPSIVSKEFSFIYTASLVLIISMSTIAEYYFGMTYTLYLQAEQKMYITSITQILVYILNTITIVVLIKLNCPIQFVKLISGIIFVLRPLMQNIYVKKKYRISLKESDKDYQLEQKWDGLAQHIAYVIHSNTDVIILTMFTQITEVSVYSVYYLIVKGVKSLIQAFAGGIDASFGDMIAKGEKEQLNKSFKIYELFYYTITTIAYVCTMLLVVPFVKVYTFGVTDANYIRPLFAYLLVLAEFIWAIRLPYSSITLAAGHFKETRKGAWVEAILNIVISIILVWKYGIIGVAIGTLIAMLIRTVEFMYHTNKYILERKQTDSIKRIFIITIELLIVVVLSKLIPTFKTISYSSWIIYACIIALLTVIVTVPTNLMIYKKESKQLLNVIKNNIIKRKS